MAEADPALLARLLAGAVPGSAFVAGRQSARPKPKQTDAAETDASGSGTPKIEEGLSATRFLIAQGTLDLGLFDPWFRHLTAWKNSYGEAGFAAHVALSEAAENFGGEESCRKHWDKIKERTEGPPLTMATYFKEARSLGWTPPRLSDTRPKPNASDRSGKEGSSIGGGKPKGTDAAAHAVDLAERAGDEFWQDQDGKPHVSYKAKLPEGGQITRHARLASGTYRNVLFERYYRDTVTNVLTGDQASLATSILEHRANESGIRHIAALRVGEHDGGIYVDLGRPDGQTVRIDGAGWTVVDEAPVRFVRGNRGELPIPVLGGSLADFERHFNLELEDLSRLLGFLIGTFNVGASYAILMVDGEQGSGKSTLADKAVGLVDPPTQARNARMSFNPKEQDLHIGALGAHVLFFDNVSTFSADAADALCRISTGGGSGARRLYTDDGYNEINVIRPLMVTCIGAPSSRPDLLDRSLRIVAQPLTGARRTERKVMAAYQADRAKMLGFLLTCVSTALKNRDRVDEAVESGTIDLPRMADFAEFVEGAGEHLGLELGGFSNLLRSGQSAMQVDAVMGNPVGAGLVAYFSSAAAAPLNMAARDILPLLRDHGPQEARWPAPNMLRKTLSRISVGLRALGIEWSVVEAEGHDNVAKFKIWTSAQFKPLESASDDGGGLF